MILSLFIKLTRSPAWAKKTWNFWYNFAHLVDGRAGNLNFMNWGYAPKDTAGKILPLDPRDENDRFPLQMYYHTIGRRALAGLDVLEVGCGRGGGARSLMKYASPRSLTGIDLSARAIALNNKSNADRALSFRVGDAENIPFPDGSFDAVVNVESSHCYPNIKAFFSEVFRVLKSGGKFFYADFRIIEKMRSWIEAIESSGFVIQEKEDITADVLRSLNRDSLKKERLIRKRVPFFLRGYFRRFACTSDTEFYMSFVNGRRFYHRYLLVKP
ncbi:MAG: class I SAM-dependent methyltransferase [Candidatus Aminicenantes bacterium]|nr:class I SAM-dependent methyltransferase [Candidatus Aminicenantes bacterium]